MPTIPASYPPRQATSLQTNYVRKVVNFSDGNVAGGYQFGTVPLNAFITRVHVDIVTAFNAGTTNVLTFGVTQQNANELVASGDVTAGTPGYSAVTRGLGRAQTQNPSNASSTSGVTSGEGGVALFAKYAQTGTAATAGQAVVVIEYVPNNDG